MRRPRTLPELHLAIRREGYTIRLGGRHAVVLTPSGNYLCALPVTPSDKRGILNAWTTFTKAKARPARRPA
jgi:hypothetical protein